jgi:glycosyltransferase involved in cell wall biosynthesis
MKVPLVSVVVPTLNQAPFIEQTLASIVGQNWPRLELIVVDGGSTDGTQAIVERYAPHLAHFISEPDRGQADAINKGMRLATGDILAWLNSDDYYLPLTVARAAAALADTALPRLVYGACLLWFEADGRTRVVHPGPFHREALTTSSFLYQPSAFWTRALWEKTGPLDETKHFVLDWDWWLRASAHGEFLAIAPCLSVYRFHPQHKTGSGSPRRTREILELVEKNAAPEWSAVFQAVASRLPALEKTFRLCAGRRGLWTLRKLAHLDLYARYGERVELAFGQLHV